MLLLTKKNLRDLPPLYAQDGRGDDAVAHVKLFLPGTGWTWYLTEYDPDDDLGFGFVVGPSPELGYISLRELRDLKTRFGGVERDRHWKPRTLREVKTEHGIAVSRGPSIAKTYTGPAGHLWGLEHTADGPEYWHGHREPGGIAWHHETADNVPASVLDHWGNLGEDGKAV
jgi:hypothetical protein